jgi:hypothetical protein
VTRAAGCRGPFLRDHLAQVIERGRARDLTGHPRVAREPPPAYGLVAIRPPSACWDMPTTFGTITQS